MALLKELAKIEMKMEVSGDVDATIKQNVEQLSSHSKESPWRLLKLKVLREGDVTKHGSG